MTRIDQEFELIRDLFDQGELHPNDAIAAYSWTVSKASRMLDISWKTLETYNPNYNWSAKNRRTPSEVTKQRTYLRVKKLIQAGVLPIYPDKLPQSLQQLIPTVAPTPNELS